MEYNSIFEITVIYMHGLKFNVKIRIHTIFLTVDHLSLAHTPAAASFHTWRNEMARLYIRQAGRKMFMTRTALICQISHMRASVQSV